MKAPSLVFISLTFFLASNALRGQDVLDSEVSAVYQRVAPSVVRLRVTGMQDGKAREPLTGTGFIFKTQEEPRVMTAAHVLGRDNDWDVDSAGNKQRAIYMWITSELGWTPLPPVATALVNPSLDVAQTFLNGGTNRGLQLSKRRPIAGESLIVISWGEDESQPVPDVARVLPRQADDGPLIRLRYQARKSESGSPVLNRKGVVVAILVAAKPNRPESFALPVAEFTGWLRDMVFVDDLPSPAKLAVPALPKDWFGAKNAPCRIQVNQPEDVDLINESGEKSKGTTRDGEVTATKWGLRGTVESLGDGTLLILWTNGTWWASKRFEQIQTDLGNQPVAGGFWIRKPAEATTIGDHGNGNLTFMNEVIKSDGSRYFSEGRVVLPGEVVAYQWESGMHGRFVMSGALLLWYNGTWWRR